MRNVCGMDSLFFAGLRSGSLEDQVHRCISCQYIPFWCVFSAFLLFYSILKEIPLKPATSLVKNSFFLYAIHFPGVRFFNKAGAVLFKGSQAAAAALFLVMPFLILGVSKISGEILKHTVPGVYEILSGGRGQ